MGRARSSRSKWRLVTTSSRRLAIGTILVVGLVVALAPRPGRAWQERPPATPTRIPGLDGDEEPAETEPESDSSQPASKELDAKSPPPSDEQPATPESDDDPETRNTTQVEPDRKAQGKPADETTSSNSETADAAETDTETGANETDTQETLAEENTDPLEALEITDVQTSSFQSITPGHTELAELKETLGEPAERISVNGKTVLLYQVGPFPRVEFVIHGEQVSSIVMRLQTPTAVAQLVQDLGLQPFRPQPVRDSSGRAVGEAYPERGVTLTYASPSEGAEDPETQPDSQQEADAIVAPHVAHITLESITADSFVRRAAAVGSRGLGAVTSSRGLGAALADVRYALRLEPNHVSASWIEARILSHVGRFAEGVAAIERAIEKSRNDPEFKDRQTLQYTLAMLLFQSGKTAEALALSKQVAVAEDASELVRARAELLWGNILSQGVERDYRQAINHHSAAIRLATGARDAAEPDMRTEALEILSEAHLAAALDVALGSWQRKPEVIPKWLDAARKLSAELDEHAQLEGRPWLAVHHAALVASAALEGTMDPAAETDELLARADELLGPGTDPLDKYALSWQLGQSVLMAARAEKSRENFERATRLATRAHELLATGAVIRDPVPEREYLLGQATFLIGALLAVAEGDHTRAVEWYDRALASFPDPLPASCSVDMGRHGERLVGMGVSYWEMGNRDRGLELTRHGANLIQQAVERRWLPQNALALAYHNLASMQRELGNDKEAAELTARADKLRSVTDRLQR